MNKTCHSQIMQNKVIYDSDGGISKVKTSDKTMHLNNNSTFFFLISIYLPLFFSVLRDITRQICHDDFDSNH